MLQIGAFSRIAQVSIGQLRYYDDIGLLKPARTDSSTGYRYYELSQLERLNRILALKNLGLSLADVARMLACETTSAEMKTILQNQKAQIEQTLREEMARLKRIERRIERLNQNVSVDVVMS
jgi:DNA-binding transcriptional MerR regulator